MKVEKNVVNASLGSTYLISILTLASVVVDFFVYCYSHCGSL